MATPYIGEYEYDGRNTVTTDLGFKLEILDVTKSVLRFELRYEDEPAFASSCTTRPATRGRPLHGWQNLGGDGF